MPDAVEELLVKLGSAVLLLTEALSEKLAPGAKSGAAETTRVKTSELPEAMAALAVWVTVPPDCPEVKASPPDACVIETKVEPAGTVSVRTTPEAGLGPLLVTVTV
jgi:hypothetical protein